MPNLASMLKAEIRRLAKREIKAATRSTKQAVAQYRRDIAMLKRLVQVQQKEIQFLRTQEQKRLHQPQTTEHPVEGVRFSVRSVRAQRRRLGLSAEDFGKLIGVSAMTVYNWEHGKGRPKNYRLGAFAALRTIGKREAMKKLEMLIGLSKKL
jgi:DNA-binding transcriptional regulator YiaG